MVRGSLVTRFVVLYCSSCAINKVGEVDLLFRFSSVRIISPSTRYPLSTFFTDCVLKPWFWILASTSWDTASFSTDVLASFLHATKVMAVIQTTAKGITTFFMCVCFLLI